jgi:hypothetical protein
MKNLIQITNDLFDIAWRLKAIDPAYTLFFNTSSKRFEVHARGHLQVALPFEKLDERTIEYVQKTRIENLQRIMDEIDEANRLAEEKENKKLMEKFYNKTEGV